MCIPAYERYMCMPPYERKSMHMTHIRGREMAEHIYYCESVREISISKAFNGEQKVVQVTPTFCSGIQ